MLWSNPAVVGLIVAGPSALLGYLAYRQSVKVDALAEQAGIATVEQGTIGQVIDGLNKHVANLQTDNEVLRQNLDVCNEKLARIIVYCEDLKQQLVDLNKRIPQTSTP